MDVKVNVTANRDVATSVVQAVGEVVRVVTPADAAAFKVNPTQLRDAFSKYHSSVCKAAYLRDPTGRTENFAYYKEPEVQMFLRPTASRILGITSEPVIVKTATFLNESGVDATFHVGISDQVEESVTSTWSTGGELSIEQAFEYKVDMLGVNVGGTTTISYTQQWGVGGEHSTRTTVGSDSAVDVVLKPGQGVIAELTATRGVMQVQIDYNAFLYGRAISYETNKTGSVIWRSPISNVMAGNNIPNSITSTETLKVGYYSNSTVVIRDIKSGSLVAEVDMQESSSEPLVLTV